MGSGGGAGPLLVGAATAGVLLSAPSAVEAPDTSRHLPLCRAVVRYDGVAPEPVITPVETSIVVCECQLRLMLVADGNVIGSRTYCEPFTRPPRARPPVAHVETCRRDALHRLDVGGRVAYVGPPGPRAGDAGGRGVPRLIGAPSGSHAGADHQVEGGVAGLVRTLRPAVRPCRRQPSSTGPRLAR